MKLSICIVNHNQDEMVEEAISKLKRQSKKPDEIIVCSDGDKPFETKQSGVIVINSDDPGRCKNRNRGAEAFLDGECDAVVFIDGDCYPSKKNFLSRISEKMEDADLLFCPRTHLMPKKKLKDPPSDYLTANMDNMWLGKKMDSTDLRIASGAFESWSSSKSFNEKLDLLLTGMISWSCCFAITRTGLEKHLKFMKRHYGRAELFDTSAFDGSWGYEDVAMGIDALYGGLKIDITKDSSVFHYAHNRTDGLFDHVRGRHLVMQRSRDLEKSVKVKDKVYLTLLISFLVYIAGVITGLVTGYISFANSVNGLMN